MRINRNTLIVFLIYVCMVANTTYLGDITHLRQYTTLVIFLYLMVDFVRKFKYYLQFKKINLTLAAFCLCVFISGILNIHTTEGETFLVSIVYIISICVAFLSFEYFAIRGKIREAIRIYYYLLLASVILNDLLMLIAPFLRQRYAHLYLFGNKFETGYLRLLAAAFAFACRRPKQGWLLAVWSVVMALVTNVITVLVGTLVMMLMLLLPTHVRRLTQNAWVAMAVLAFCSLVLVLYEGITKVTVVNQVVDYFGREGTFGARLYIYSILLPIIAKKPIFGYGCHNAYYILMRRNIVNTQNGLMENFFSFGYVGGALFLLLVFNALRRSFQGNKKECYPLYVLVIVYFVMSSVEICLDVGFVFVLTAAMGLSFVDEEEEEEEEPLDLESEGNELVLPEPVRQE